MVITLFGKHSALSDIGRGRFRDSFWGSGDDDYRYHLSIERMRRLWALPLWLALGLWGRVASTLKLGDAPQLRRVSTTSVSREVGYPLA